MASIQSKETHYRNGHHCYQHNFLPDSIITDDLARQSSTTVTIIKFQSELVSGCFEPSQPQRIISGLRKTFIKGYVIERTNKAKIRSEEQSEKVESFGENLWNEIQLKGP